MPSAPPESACLATPTPRPQARVTLICCHHAGGDASVYSLWSRHLPAAIEVRPAQLPGRSVRLSQPPHTSIDASAAGLADAIHASVRAPFVLFGHSMGALVAFETTRQLRRLGRTMPALLIVAGRPAPHLSARRAPIHRLPDEQFIEQVIDLGGTPPEVFADPDLAAIFLPILRADFTAVETYRPAVETPLPVPIAGFAGTTDPWTHVSDVAGWARHTTAEFSLHTFPGGHFFLRDRADAVKTIAELTLAAA